MHTCIHDCNKYWGFKVEYCLFSWKSFVYNKQGKGGLKNYTLLLVLLKRTNRSKAFFDTDDGWIIFDKMYTFCLLFCALFPRVLHYFSHYVQITIISHLLRRRSWFSRKRSASNRFSTRRIPDGIRDIFISTLNIYARYFIKMHDNIS